MNYLIEYQKVLGLVPDGKIGPKTVSAIKKDLGIANSNVIAHLLGQMRLESGNFTHFREGTKYTDVSRMRKIFKRYRLNPARAASDVGNAEKIANFVYADRNGNGGEQTGDGWKFRGAFGLQLTGKTNFNEFYASVGIPLNTDPDTLVNDVRMYFKAGLFWFTKNKVIPLCKNASKECILSVGRAVNLGDPYHTAMPHDWELREQYTRDIYEVL
jgi:putative chitinase